MPLVAMQPNLCSLIQCGSGALGSIPGLLVLADLLDLEKRTRRMACVFGEL